jgi:hypothetical protein
MSRSKDNAQLEFAAVTRRHIDYGLLAAIGGHLDGRVKRKHVRISVRELSELYVLPVAKVRQRVDTMIVYGMVVEESGVLHATGVNPSIDRQRKRGLGRDA